MVQRFYFLSKTPQIPRSSCIIHCTQTFQHMNRMETYFTNQSMLATSDIWEPFSRSLLTHITPNCTNRQGNICWYFCSTTSMDVLSSTQVSPSAPTQSRRAARGHRRLLVVWAAHAACSKTQLSARSREPAWHLLMFSNCSLVSLGSEDLFGITLCRCAVARCVQYSTTCWGRLSETYTALQGYENFKHLLQHGEIQRPLQKDTETRTDIHSKCSAAHWRLISGGYATSSYTPL